MARSVGSIRTSLLRWYRENGRRDLPWRVARDPYYTVVSEFMLQQTQVDRVVRSFSAFVARFPSFAALSRASAADVIRSWQGLGYNSRALRLKSLADIVVERYAGKMPRETAALRALPGIGAYTAAAVRAFAFDFDDAPVDTNVRRIVQRLLYGIHSGTQTATQLEAGARALLPIGKAHDWSSAMMDLGATICTSRTPACGTCPLARSCTAAPVDWSQLQALRKSGLASRARPEKRPFMQTARYARGRIVDRLRELPAGAKVSLLDLHRSLDPLLHSRSIEEFGDLVDGLKRDGLIACSGDALALPD